MKTLSLKTTSKAMEKIILTIKDDRKKNFLLELLKQFDFIEVQKATEKKQEQYDFFASAGLWKDRDINANQLREQAWKRSL
jgi:predicted nuclease of restriction endonuclease-like (RecB) superfamily